VTCQPCGRSCSSSRQKHDNRAEPMGRATDALPVMAHPDPSHVPMKTFTRVRAIANLLRVAAISIIFSGLSFSFPETWIDSFLVWCGMGQMPHEALMRYVLRGAGYLQVAGGVFILVLASDVVRYKPLVMTVLALLLLGAPSFYLIDASAGLPRWWCMMDFACCFLAGGVPLTFCLWPSAPNPQGH
jgi:hypothetical protein